MRLGGRNDLTVAQRETVQNIWANWSVRRAAAAMDNGNVAARRRHSRRRLAGLSRQSRPCARPWPAAMRASAAPRKRWRSTRPSPCRTPPRATSRAPSARLWPPTTRPRPRSGCARRSSASRAIPPFSRSPPATSRPAATTSAPPTTIAPRWPPCPRPRPSTGWPTCSSIPSRTRKAHRAVTAADLQRLLDPDYEPFAKTTKLPPLPAYGPDPYDGAAPVVLPPSQPPRSRLRKRSPIRATVRPAVADNSAAPRSICSSSRIRPQVALPARIVVLCASVATSHAAVVHRAAHAASALRSIAHSRGHPAPQSADAILGQVEITAQPAALARLRCLEGPHLLADGRQPQR